MQLRIGFDIVTRQTAPTPMVLMLNTRAELANVLIRPDALRMLPEIPHREYRDSYGNRCVRLIAPEGALRIFAEGIIENSGLPDEIVPDAEQHPIEDLPDECLTYLLSSRYCEVDELSGFAWETFGGSALGWGRVQAVCDYVHNHVTFGYEHASPTKTAADVLKTGTGVCRDFQHLAVTLCRALGIPARYVSGYISDVGFPTDAPGDFSAWFEVYLGGRWRTFDARHNKPRIGRVLMTVGRDATDVALITSFGPHQMENFEVFCEDVTPSPPPASG
jgi:transglutaminase-like putative cysteine protease